MLAQASPSIVAASPTQRTRLLWNGSFIVLAIVTMACASRLLPSDGRAVAIRSFVLPGTAFQVVLLAVAGAIVAGNRRIDPSSTRVLWRTPRARAIPYSALMTLLFAVGATTLLAYVAITRSGSAGVGALASPWALLIPAFAASNAFAEEVMTRFTVLQLGSLPQPVAIMVSACAFGFMHLSSGTPSGVTGFAMTFALGALLMKCVSDTASLRYALILHFGLDLIVFATLLLSVPRTHA